MTREHLPKLEKTDEEINNLFVFYLNQRGGITLEQFCTALGMSRVAKGGHGAKRNFRKEERERVDALCTAALVSPTCRRQDKDGTVRYLLEPPP